MPFYPLSIYMDGGIELPPQEQQLGQDQDTNLHNQQTYFLIPSLFNNPIDILNLAREIYIQSGGTANILIYSEPTPDHADSKIYDLSQEDHSSILADEVQAELTKIENRNLEHGKTTYTSQLPVIAGYSTGGHMAAIVKDKLAARGQEAVTCILDEPEFSILHSDAYSTDENANQRFVTDLLDIAESAAALSGISSLKDYGLLPNENFLRVLPNLHTQNRITRLFKTIISKINENEQLNEDQKLKLAHHLQIAARNLRNMIGSKKKSAPSLERKRLDKIYTLITKTTIEKYNTDETGGWSNYCKAAIDLDPSNETGLKDAKHLELLNKDYAVKVAKLLIDVVRAELRPEKQYAATVHKNCFVLGAAVRQFASKGLSREDIMGILESELMKVYEEAQSASPPKEDSSPLPRYAAVSHSFFSHQPIATQPALAIPAPERVTIGFRTGEK